jgi:hypothetical protein
MKRIKGALAALVMAVAMSGAQADPVYQVYEFGMQAPVAELVPWLSKGKAIVSSLNPGTEPILLVPVAGGEEQMTATVVVAYPNLQAYGAAATKIQTSADYAQFQAAWPMDKFPVRSVSIMNATIAPAEGQPLQTGEMLAVYRFVANGPIGGLAQLIQQAQSITGSATTMVVPVFAGSRGPVVSTRHKNMAAWAESAAANNANTKLQEFMASFPTDTYQVEFRGLSQVVQIP